MRQTLEEFRRFAMRGNAIDLAVAVILGAAFGRIVSSLVEDLLMPLIGAIPFVSADFSNLYLPLSGEVSNAIQQAGAAGLSLEEAKKIGPIFAYGHFITTVINFSIVAFAIFLLIKAINHLHKGGISNITPPPPADVVLLTEIRNLLKEKGGQSPPNQ